MLGISERKACRYVGQHRSTQRRERSERPQDEQLKVALRAIAKKRPRSGYRTAGSVLRMNGVEVNDKRVHRLWRQEGLQRPQRARKRQRLGWGGMPAERREAACAEDVWSIDFCFDQTTDALPLKFLIVLDEFTRHNHILDVSRSIGADGICDALDRAAALHGPPKHLRCDNGPEMVSHALRDWCRFAGTDVLFIEPGSPWQNGYGESFIGTVRDELLNCELFHTVAEAQLLADIFRDDYNQHRPHSSLGGIPPTWYRERLTQRDTQLS